VVDRRAEAAAVSGIASGSQHSTIKAISHLMARSESPPTPSRYNCHLQFRAAGRPEVRSAEQLFDDVGDQMEGKFNIRRYRRTEESSRKKAMSDRVRQSAASLTELAVLVLPRLVASAIAINLAMRASMSATVWAATSIRAASVAPCVSILAAAAARDMRGAKLSVALAPPERQLL
jgi:hypothetical protein